jgi:hypothetical protein
VPEKWRAQECIIGIVHLHRINGGPFFPSFFFPFGLVGVRSQSVEVLCLDEEPYRENKDLRDGTRACIVLTSTTIDEAIQKPGLAAHLAAKREPVASHTCLRCCCAPLRLLAEGAANSRCAAAWISECVGELAVVVRNLTA